MRKVIYTCILNGHDTLKEDFPKIPGFDYICFTDDLKLKSKLWTIKHYPRCGNPRVQSRYPKMMPHKMLRDYNLTVWVDGRVTISDIPMFIEAVENCKGFTAPKHPHRTCIYVEADYCKLQRLGNPVEIDKQIQEYRKEGYPEDNGLTMNGMIIRLNNVGTNIFNSMWYDEYMHQSERDQLCLGYVAWRLGIKIDVIPTSVIKWGAHVRRRESQACIVRGIVKKLQKELKDDIH